MTGFELWTRALGAVVVGGPVALTVALGGASLLGRPPREERTSRLVEATIVSGLLATLAMLVTMLATGSRRVAVDFGEWVAVADSYHFRIKFVFDRLSVPVAILSFVLIGTIGAFASRYLHRERGFNRFFVLYSVFALGMIATSLAGTMETLFAGWELVGLSSALLVGFYHERRAPSRNALWVWSVYRFSDAALLLAVVTMHRLRGAGDLDVLFGFAAWPEARADVTAAQAFLVGLLLLTAAAGKSALAPFSGWLPRAMEGPTPSSAVFYGALSVHLGAFLLMRTSPLWERSLAMGALVAALGLATAAFAHVVGAAGTDIKSALSFASLAQVGMIVAETGAAGVAGWVGGRASGDVAVAAAAAAVWLRYVALAHFLGHACLRTLQFLRAPTLLHDYHQLENAIGEGAPRPTAAAGRRGDARAEARRYRFALERGFLDAALTTFVAAPFTRALRRCDSLERRWTDWLSGEPSRESDQVKPRPGTFDEVL